MPHIVCVCSIHANFTFLFEAIKPFLDSVNSYHDLMEKALCNTDREDCVLEKCDECKNFDVRTCANLNYEEHEEIQVQKWERI